MRQIKKNLTFTSKNGERSAKKASGHSAESEYVVFIVDLRNCGCDWPCKTPDRTRGTAVKAIHAEARELTLAIRQID